MLVESWKQSRYLISLFSCLLAQDSVCYLPLGLEFRQLIRIHGFTVKSLGLYETTQDCSICSILAILKFISLRSELESYVVLQFIAMSNFIISIPPKITQIFLRETPCSIYLIIMLMDSQKWICLKDFTAAKPDCYLQVFVLKSRERKIAAAADVLWHVIVPGVQSSIFASRHQLNYRGMEQYQDNEPPQLTDV